MAASIPSADLLRVSRDIIDRLACSDAIFLRNSYDHARAVDALRHTSQRLALFHECDWASSVDSFTLPTSMKHAVHQMSFFSDIAEVRSPLASLLSKVLNSRCQARKYGTVAEKSLIESDQQRRKYEGVLQAREWNDDPLKRPAAMRAVVQGFQAVGAMRKDFKTVLLCSLLGNYPHCESRVHGVQTRAACYRLFQDTDWFFQSLLHQCPSLVIWCLRDYLVHVLIDNSGLRAQVAGLMQLSRFRELVQKAMATARAYFLHNLPHAWSELGAAAAGNDELLCRCMCNRRNGQPKSSAPPCAHAREERHGGWLRDLSAALFPFHEPMLAISYRKPDTSELSLLLSVEVRKPSAAPLVPRPLAPGEAVAEDEQPDGENSSDDEDGGALIRRMGLAAQEAERNKRKRERKAAELADTQVTQRPFVYLTPAQFDCLSYLVETLPEQARLSDVVDRIAANGFGMSTAAADFIRKLLHSHRDGTVTRNQRIKAIIALQRRDPHSYNLLQVAAELLRNKELRDATVVGELPAEALRAQIEACERRWGTQGAVERSAISLHVCTICGSVYSNVKDAHALHAKFYRYGLFNAVRDYETGEVYCRQSRVTHRGSCRDTPLASVCLLGIRYHFERKVYQLCVGCGDIMVPDARSCRHALGGMLCCECTASSRSEESKTDTTAGFLKALDRTCVCCNKRAISPFLYPHGVVVCHRHHSRFMMRQLALEKPCTKQACVDLVVNIHTSWRARCRQRAKSGDNKRMNARRQRDRGKRA